MKTELILIDELEQYCYEMEMAGYTDWPEYETACELLDQLFIKNEKGA
jgi:hypothetical protein